MRIAVAIAVSVLVHLILAAGLVWYFTVAPNPVVLAQLDLSSVELSLAEEDTAEAVPIASLPSAPSSETLESERVPDETAPEPEKVEAAIPELTAPALPEVTPEVPVLPEVKPPVQPPKPAPVQPPKPAQASVPVSEPAVAPKQAKVDAPPTLRRTIRPDYPTGARQRGEQGDVLLEIRVTEKGEVDEVRVVVSSGFPELDAAAVRATKAARFRPAKSGRVAVASLARLTINFKLK